MHLDSLAQQLDHFVLRLGFLQCQQRTQIQHVLYSNHIIPRDFIFRLSITLNYNLKLKVKLDLEIRF